MAEKLISDAAGNRLGRPVRRARRCNQCGGINPPHYPVFRRRAHVSIAGYFSTRIKTPCVIETALIVGIMDSTKPTIGFQNNPISATAAAPEENGSGRRANCVSAAALGSLLGISDRAGR
jgi:hypothetical protein